MVSTNFTLMDCLSSFSFTGTVSLDLWQADPETIPEAGFTLFLNLFSDYSFENVTVSGNLFEVACCY